MGRPVAVGDAMQAEEFLQATMGSMDLVYNIARRVAPTPEDAQDLVQETYLAAYRAWCARRRPRRVEPWLATICLNLTRSAWRRRSHRPQEIPWEVASALGRDTDYGDPQNEAIEQLEREAVHRALAALPEGQRVAITLVDLSGFSTHDAAKIVNTPRGAVLSRLHRGRRALALLLRAEVEEDAT